MTDPQKFPPITQTTQQQAAEELSSGYRIDRRRKTAAQDPNHDERCAQLEAIRLTKEKVEAELALLREADKSLAKVQSILLQMKELAALAKNSSLTTAERKGLNKKILLLQKEMNRISLTYKSYE
jgi:flagellin-like hook-associated protein FlgL